MICDALMISWAVVVTLITVSSDATNTTTLTSDSPPFYPRSNAYANVLGPNPWVPSKDDTQSKKFVARAGSTQKSSKNINQQIQRRLDQNVQTNSHVVYVATAQNSYGYNPAHTQPPPAYSNNDAHVYQTHIDVISQSQAHRHSRENTYAQSDESTTNSMLRQLLKHAQTTNDELKKLSINDKDTQLMLKQLTSMVVKMKQTVIATENRLNQTQAQLLKLQEQLC